MSGLFVTLDVREILKLKMNFNEYLNLLKLQHSLEKRDFPFVLDERFIAKQIELGYIVIEEDGTFTLGPAGLKVFGEEEDLFEEFYAVFPYKVPTGLGFRPVSTQDPNGTSAGVTRAIWKRVTKHKTHIQRNIINNLKRELDHRKADGSLGYLQGIDTWLRQATWEKWESIPDKKIGPSSKKL